MLLAMPNSLRVEHDELRADLEEAIRIGGRIGELARALEPLMHVHLRKEDNNVFLALGLLQSVAQDKVTPAMREMVVIADRLKTELPEMLAEHVEIRRSLERMGQAAMEEGRPKIASFAAKLLHHARLEEEVLYPAAVVLGEYLRSRLSPAAAPPSNDKQ
jgi:hemerythrin-like domain-containing protein